MDDRALARALSIGRAAIGVSLVAVPQAVGGAWVGPDGNRPTTKVFARALGIRDVGLAVGTLLALADGEGARRWLQIGVACDATDFVATYAAGRALPAGGRLTTFALAGGAALVGARLALALD